MAGGPKNDAQTADIIIVGLGAAGASAAIEARALGADVLVLERASAGGGSTAYSGGFIYLGGGTRVQKVNGFEDTAEEMFKFLMASTPEPDEGKIRLYCDDSVSHFDWIEAQGVIFNDGFYPHKHFEHPTKDGLAWSGNEKAWPYFEKAKPAPRGHKVSKPDGEGKLGEGGFHLAYTLIERAREAGARIECDARVTELFKDEAGRVVGARYKQFGKETFATARNGLILATGGFGENKDMAKRYSPELSDDRVYIVGTPYADGAGIDLGLSVGGTTGYIGALITAPFYPPASLLKGILVNKNGERFINEDSYHGRSCTASFRQPGGIAYLICDNAIFERPEFDSQPLIDAWESVANMERDLNIPEGALQRTVTAYNENAAKGEDPTFHKTKEWLQPLDNPPYAALDCSVGKATYSGFTLGGLKVSVDGEVLDKADQPIAGLYAAGACASTIAQDSIGYASGTCIGESTYFGRRAGRHAVNQKL
jgi:3-oxo-5alpha-steroid 4-dehydrogenase